MGRKEQSSWIDDAFDDKKAQEEIERLKGSNRLGCIFLALLLIIAVVVILSFVGILGTLGSI